MPKDTEPTKRSPSDEPRLLGRSEILLVLKGRHELTPIEVTEDNVLEMRRTFEDVEPGNLAWTIPGTPFHSVIRCKNGQLPPVRGVVRWPEGGHTGQVVLIAGDVLCLRDASSLLTSLLTGTPFHAA